MDWMIVALVVLIAFLFGMIFTLKQGSIEEKFILTCLILAAGVLLYMAYSDNPTPIYLLGGTLRVTQAEDNSNFIKQMISTQVDHYMHVGHVLTVQEEKKMIKKISILLHDSMEQGLIDDQFYLDTCKKTHVVL